MWYFRRIYFSSGFLAGPLFTMASEIDLAMNSPIEFGFPGALDFQAELISSALGRGFLSFESFCSIFFL